MIKSAPIVQASVLANSAPRLVTQPSQKRLEKASKLFVPIRRLANDGRPSKSRLPMSHRKTDLGIPPRSKSALVLVHNLRSHACTCLMQARRCAGPGVAPLNFCR